MLNASSTQLRFAGVAELLQAVVRERFSALSCCMCRVKTPLPGPAKEVTPPTHTRYLRQPHKAFHTSSRYATPSLMPAKVMPVFNDLERFAFGYTREMVVVWTRESPLFKREPLCIFLTTPAGTRKAATVFPSGLEQRESSLLKCS